MSATTLRVVPAARSYALVYYHAHKELMNIQSYLSKLNRAKREPRYAQRVAYGLSKDPSGVWRMGEDFKRLMMDRALARMAEQQAPTPREERVVADLINMVRDMTRATPAE